MTDIQSRPSESTDVCWIFEISWTNRSLPSVSIRLQIQTPSGTRAFEQIHVRPSDEGLSPLVAQTARQMGFPELLIPSLLQNFDWSGSHDHTPLINWLFEGHHDFTVQGEMERQLKMPQRMRRSGWKYQLSLHKGRHTLRVRTSTPSGIGWVREISMRTVRKCGNEDALKELVMSHARRLGIPEELTPDLLHHFGWAQVLEYANNRASES